MAYTAAPGGGKFGTDHGSAAAPGGGKFGTDHGSTDAPGGGKLGTDHGSALAVYADTKIKAIKAIFKRFHLPVRMILAPGGT